MRIVAWLTGILTTIAAVAAVFVWSGVYNVAADEPHWKATAQLLEVVRHRSLASRATGVAVPALDDAEMIQGGAGNYDAMCAGCHLRPGLDGSEISAGLYPAPPNLSRRRQAEPARDYLAIKHGIKMTGMPAWGGSMEDRYIWGMVSLIRKLPDLSPAEYRELVDASGGHSHGPSTDAPDESGDTGADGQAGEKKTHVHADGSEHKH